MSGILNKSERFFDTIITERGRELLSKDNYNIAYATVSDVSILYEKDFEKSLLLPVSVSDSEYFYLPMESDTALNNIVDDFVFKTNYSTIYNVDTDLNDDISDVTVINSLRANFAGEKIKNNFLISDRNFSSNKDLVFRVLSPEGDVFNFNSPEDSIRYQTVSKEVAVLSETPTILNDIRFYHKTNNKILNPVNSTGEAINLPDTEESLNIENNASLLSVLKTYDVNFSPIDANNREATISQLINHLEENKSIIRKNYLLKDVTENDEFILEMFEVDFNARKMEKLALIDIGKFYDNENGISKDVYLIGKILNSRNNVSVANNKKMENISYVYREKNNFYLSSLYTYVNMFVLVAE